MLVMTSYPQSQNKIDSLLVVAKNSKIDSNLVKTYEKITRLYLKINFDSSKVYAQKMIDLSQEINYQKGYAMGNNWLGETYFLQGKYDTALKYYKITNKTFEKIGKNKLWSYSLIVIANAYSMIGENDSSKILYKQVIDFNKSKKDILSASKSMINLAQLYSNVGQFTLAKKYLYEAKLNFKTINNDQWTNLTDKTLANLYGRIHEHDSALVIYKSLINSYTEKDDFYALGEAYANLSVLYEGIGEFDSALVACKKSLEYRNIVNDPRGKAVSEMNLASVYFNLKEYDSILQYLESSRTFLEKTNSYHPLTYNYLLTGNYYAAIKELQKAENMYLKSYELANKYGSEDMQRDAAQKLSNIYEEIQDFKNALKYAKIYKVKYDTILNEQNIKDQTIAKEGYKYKVQLFDKEKEILLEKQQKNYLLIAGIISVFIFAFFIFQRRKLHNAKLLQISQENDLKVKKAELEMQRTERKRLASILHDNIAHLITSSQNHISSLINKDNNTSEEVTLKKVEDTLKLTHKMAKIASYELEFSFVLESSIVDQLSKYINRIQHSNSPKINFEYTDKEQFDNLPDNIKTNLFSVFQEMLGNALKYSNAKTITISLVSDEEKTTLQIIDDGIGFNYDEVRHGQGFPNMKERAEKLNGKFSFESEVGFGTKLRFTV